MASNSVNWNDVKSVCDWLRSHPNCVSLPLNSYNNAELLLLWLTRDDLFGDDETNEKRGKWLRSMLDKNECNYVFQKGNNAGFRCNKQTSDEKLRCDFHDHKIFSPNFKAEVTNFINQLIA